MSSHLFPETMERVQVHSHTGPSKEEGKTKYRRETLSPAETTSGRNSSNQQKSRFLISLRLCVQSHN